jgi:DNA polymerase III epsilon subunit-like protein
MRILALDVETGGLDPRKHSLLQVGLIAYDSETAQILGTDEFTIRRHTYDTTPEAMRVNNLYLDQVYANGETPADAAERIINFIRRHFGEIINRDDRPLLLGHNVAFDKYFLQYQIFDAVGMDMDKYISHRLIDVMSILHGLRLSGKIPPISLSSKGAAEYFGIENKMAHTAVSDAYTTLQVFENAIHLMRYGS